MRLPRADARRLNPIGKSNFYSESFSSLFPIPSNDAVVAGGLRNTAGFRSFVGSGEDNYANSASAIAGGYHSSAISPFGFIRGGYSNVIANQQYAVIAGGTFNHASGGLATIGGGWANRVSGWYASVGGVEKNQANNSHATVSGGVANVAGGAASFAAGTRARALADGSFVWADRTAGNFTSASPDQFPIRASGGVGIGLADPAAQLEVSSGGGDGFPQARVNQSNPSDYARLRFTVGGDYPLRWDVACRSNVFLVYSGQFYAEMLRLDSAGLTVRGTLVSTSDRNLKENVQSVNKEEILKEVVALPISRWNYKQDNTSTHIGPMAQDFHAAFGVGPDDKHIATVDADGVALAAIQGLNQKVEGKESRIQALEKQLATLKELVAKLATTKD